MFAIVPFLDFHFLREIQWLFCKYITIKLQIKCSKSKKKKPVYRSGMQKPNNIMYYLAHNVKENRLDADFSLFIDRLWDGGQDGG